MLREKKKMLVTSIFFFSHNVFKRLFPPVRQKSSLCGNRLKETWEVNVERNITKARRTAYSLMASGLHGENSVDPETAIFLINSYVSPILLYGLEILLPASKEILNSNSSRSSQMFSLPTNTKDEAIYMLSDVLPGEAQIPKRTLTLYNNKDLTL